MKSWLAKAITLFALLGPSAATGIGCTQCGWHGTGKNNHCPVEYKYKNTPSSNMTIPIKEEHYDRDVWCVLLKAEINNNGGELGIQVNGTTKVTLTDALKKLRPD